MTDYTIPADTVAFDVSASSVGLLPFVSTTPWLWGDDEAILWGDDEEITFGFAYLRNWDTQSVAVTPLDISYSFDYALPAGAATFAVDAKDLVLSGVNYTLPADTLAFSVSTPSSEFRRTYIIDAATTSVDVSELAVELDYSGAINIESASFSISTPASSLLRGWQIDADIETFDVTASAATLAKGVTLDAGPSSLVITPSAIGGLVDSSLDAAVARFTIAGSDLTFSMSENPLLTVFGYNVTNVIGRENTSVFPLTETSTALVDPEYSTEHIGIENTTDIVIFYNTGLDIRIES